MFKNHNLFYFNLRKYYGLKLASIIFKILKIISLTVEIKIMNQGNI